jgi:hypothetical protein
MFMPHPKKARLFLDTRARHRMFFGTVFGVAIANNCTLVPQPNSSAGRGQGRVRERGRIEDCEGDIEQKDMIYRSGRQTSLILREDKLGEREFRVNKLKHLTADLIHRDIENLADSL